MLNLFYKLQWYGDNYLGEKYILTWAIYMTYLLSTSQLQTAPGLR